MKSNISYRLGFPAGGRRGFVMLLIGMGISVTPFFALADTVVAPPNYLNPGSTIPNLTPGRYPASDATGFLEALKYLNGSASPQQKKGSLTIGQGQPGDPIASICLNSDPDAPATDPVNCITSWDAYRTATGAGKIPVSSASPVTLASPTLGLMRLQPTDGLFTLIAVAPPISATYPETIGLYARDVLNVGAAYTGFFSGKTVIGSRSFGVTKKLCLNGVNDASLVTNSPPTPSTGCISRWADLFFDSGGTSYLTLQPATSTVNIETGQISARGSVTLGSMIAGSPAGLPISSTCGDGVCNGNEPSSPDSCAIDCAAVFTPATLTAHAAVNLTTGAPYIAFTTRTWSNAVNQYVMVVRKTGSPPLGAPMQGVSYAMNATIGDATVVYISPGLVGPNQQFPGFSTNANGISAGQTYYYVAYSFNSLYRYSQGLSTFASMPNSVPLTFNYTFANAGFLEITVVNDGTYFTESVVCTTSCTKRAIPGQQIDLVVEAINANYCMNGYSGLCSTTEPSCRFTVPATGGSATVNFNSGISCENGGGGGGVEDPPPIIRGP